MENRTAEKLHHINEAPQVRTYSEGGLQRACKLVLGSKKKSMGNWNARRSASDRAQKVGLA